MTANGTADDYDVARKRKIAEAFAAEVDGADADDVRVHVILIVDKAVYDSPSGTYKAVPEKVFLIVDVAVPVAALSASTAAAALAPKLASVSDASTFLAPASVAVISVDATPTMLPPPSPPPGPPPPTPPPPPPPTPPRAVAAAAARAAHRAAAERPAAASASRPARSRRSSPRRPPPPSSSEC